MTAWEVERECGEALTAPDGDGIEGLGWIDHGGARFRVRLVRWTEQTAAAANLVANSRHIAGDWTPLALPQLEALRLPELEPLRFAELEAELRVAFPPEPREDADDVPEPPADPVSRRGDLWVLGEHRLVVGDSTDPAVVARALDGHAPDLMVMDPPFQLDYSAWSIPESVQVLMVWGRGHQHIRWEAELCEGWGVQEYVFVGGVRGYPMDALPCTIHDTVHMWRSKKGVLSKGFDAATLMAGSVEVAQGDGPIRPKSVQHGGGVLSGPTSYAKPIVAFAIAYSYVPPGSVIWDPCAGAGSSLIAAERFGRRWIGCEIEPDVADLALVRWQRETGEQPRPEPDDGRRVVDPAGRLHLATRKSSWRKGRKAVAPE